MAAQTMEQLVSLAKRRGFIFPGSDIYGGLQGTFDYGPLGVELKNNLKAAWWRSMVHEREDIEGLDASILTHPKVLHYSGHEDTFSDPMVDCRACKARMRADHIKDGKCEVCGSEDLTEPRPFNLMFKTTVGPVADGDSFAYLRPETAQAIFSQFKNIVDSTSRRLPFGVVQIGKAFRNEITPRNFLFRVREFEQMELEYFVVPGEDEQAHKDWIERRLDWWRAQGLVSDHLQIEHQKPEELAHYAKATADILYKFPHGFEELEGVANRTDFDLGSHSKAQKELGLSAKVMSNQHSRSKLTIPHPVTQKPIVPFVIEPSAGVDRGVLAVMTEAFHEETLENGSKRTVLKFRPHLSPIKAAVIPLAKNKPHLVEKARSIRTDLQSLGLGRIHYESGGNIGKGYRRHDEIGTPLCITVDFDTMGEGEDASAKDTVTVRDRDTLKQERVPISELKSHLAKRLLSL